MRKLIATVALVTAVAVGGLAVAAVNPLNIVSATSASQSKVAADPGTATTAAKAAKRPGVEVLNRALAGLVEKGTITKAQAVSVRQAVRASAKEYLAEHPGLRAAVVRRTVRRGVLAVSAKTIGITPKDLFAGLKSGKSIAQIAQAKGVQPEAVITAIVDGGTAKLDAAVKAGKIDAARAAKIKQRLPDLAEKAVSRIPGHKGS